MKKILYFSETHGLGITVRLDSGENCTFSIAQWNDQEQGSVRVKKSRFGILGKIIYEEKNKEKVITAVSEINKKFPENIIPVVINHPVLRTYANLIWHCKSLDEVVDIMTLVHR